jgi:CHAT domain-containing protein
VAAFHCAGAPSIISSLWNLHRDAGLRFSELFYNHLNSQQPKLLHRSETDALPFVDMARAAQHTVIELMRSSGGETLALSHWAGIVLNGSWVLPYAWVHHQTEITVQE